MPDGGWAKAVMGNFQRQTLWAPIVLMAGLLIGCETALKVQPTTPFHSEPARRQLSPGTEEIAGSAILWLSSGGIISCAGSEVTLYPLTPYAREWFHLTYETMEKSRLTPPDFAYRSNTEEPLSFQSDPAFLRQSRTVLCNEDGHFLIDRVAEGDYILVARLRWQRHIWDEHQFFNGHRYHEYEGTAAKKIRVFHGRNPVVSLRWSVANSRFNLW